MSMINDALRRASSAARGTIAPPPAATHSASTFPAPPPLGFPENSLPPGLEPEEHSSRKSTFQLSFALVLVFVVAAVAVLNHFHKKRQEQVVGVSANTGSNKILPNANAIQVGAQTLSAVTNRAAAATTPLAVAAAPPVVAVPAAPVVPPKFPQLWLQSIFYRPANPSVMINGRTLYLDDEVQGVTVADIQPSSVTLVLSGHTNVLTLR